MEAQVVRRTAAIAAGTLAIGMLAVALVPTAHAAEALPSDQQVARALVPFAQLRELALRPIAGRGAAYAVVPTDAAPEVSSTDGVITGYRSADASAAGYGTSRTTSIQISFGTPRSAPTCPVDPGAQQRMVTVRSCESVRYSVDDRHPDVVAYAIRVAPDVVVTASVGNTLPGLAVKGWRTPTAAAMTRAAKRLAMAQAARLRAQHIV